MNRIPSAHRWALVAMIAIAVAGALVFLLWSTSAAAQPAAAKPPLSAEALGWGLFSAALATGLATLGAGIAVARLGTAAVGALAEKPELLGRLLIFVGLAEGIAIYGVIVSILILERLA
jgi:V/A-type H+-transporting ATPase subunit K